MFDLLPSSSAAIVVIFTIFVGILFLCQTFVKLFFYVYAKLKKTDFSGYELFDFLRTKNGFEESKVKIKKFSPISTFYSYKKSKNEFTVCNYTYSKENLESNIRALETVVYANEKTNRSVQYRWQFRGIVALSIVPYIILIITMLMTYLPQPEPSGQVAMKYWITNEALCIIGWIIILVTFFWWMSATQNLEIEMEEQIKKINNKALDEKVRAYLNLCSYIPFSFRTVA